MIKIGSILQRSISLRPNRIHLGDEERGILSRITELFRSQDLTSRRDEACFQNWLYLEKYRNGIQPRPNNPLATFSQVESPYKPDNDDGFSLPLFPVSKERCQIFQMDTLDPRIENAYCTESHVLFAVHPQVAKDEWIKEIKEISQGHSLEVHASATASSRTVAVLNQKLPPHCLKTHFPFQITRSVRHLEARKIRHSVTLSKDLEQMKPISSFGFLPESLGVVYGFDEKSWGYLVREMTPRPFVPKGRTLLPLFSLYSPSRKEPNKKPLLCEMIEKNGENPESFVLEKVYFPLLENWAKVLVETGILLEAHGQNTCLEVDSHGQIKRTILRDFDTYVNRTIRENKGLSLEGLNPFELFETNGTADAPQGSHMSIIYDQAMRVPLDRIAEVMEKHYKIPRSQLQEKCRKFLKQVFPNGDLHFPTDNKIYNYASGALAVGAKAELVVTGETPLWR